MSKQSKRNTQKNLAKKRTKRSQKSKEKKKANQELNNMSKEKKLFLHNLMQQLQKIQKQ
tara:strand:- start:319 stop:495 length:177 start_codon:yes stop_codon:yes gene_type:complete